MGFNHTFFLFFVFKAIYISGLVNVKAFSAPQKYEGRRNSNSVGISSIVCCSLSFPYCVCARVCVFALSSDRK